MYAPIPPVPMPVSVEAGSTRRQYSHAKMLARLRELTQYMGTTALQSHRQGLNLPDHDHNPPPSLKKLSKIRKPWIDQLRVRSNEQIKKRRTQRLQRKSHVCASARAVAESRQIRDAAGLAALARQRYDLRLSL